jgi:hypothetical protein
VNPSEPEAIERRIERFIVIVGGAMAVAAALKWGVRGSVGVVLGTALCWANFRWLRHKATAIINLGMAQAGAEAVHVPRGVHAKFFARLLLLLVVGVCYSHSSQASRGSSYMRAGRGGAGHSC